MRLYEVTFRLRNPDRTRDVRVRADDDADARRRACRRLYGSRAFWWRDSGLGPDFGQVMASNPARIGGANAVTYRIRVDVRAL